MSLARVKIYDRSTPGYPDELHNEFVTSGMQPFARNKNFPDLYGKRHFMGEYEVKPDCYFYVFCTTYEVYPPNPGMPRSEQHFILIADKWDDDTRQGNYIQMPYGGRIEITAE